MPSDASGVHSLPDGYLAVTGDTIQASQHNPPLEDLSAGLTERLMKTGANAMTGPLKLPNGSAAAPAMTFANATNVGFIRTTNGIGVVVNGALICELDAVSPFMRVGMIVDWPGFAAPTGWLACDGQSLLRASYPDLFSLLGTFYGAADATHFNIPNLQGAVTAHVDSSARGLLTGGTALGALLGTQATTISQANLPSYTLPNTLGWAQDTGTSDQFGSGSSGGVAVNNSPAVQAVPLIADIQKTQAITVTGHLTGSITSGGSGTAMSVVQPTVVLNKIIFTGVA